MTQWIRSAFTPVNYEFATHTYKPSVAGPRCARWNGPHTWTTPFEAPTRFDGLFAGIVVPRSVWQRTPGQGTEHIRPEDVGYGGENDVDYGRLLDEAMGCGGKEVRPQRDSNPCFGLERVSHVSANDGGNITIPGRAVV